VQNSLRIISATRETPRNSRKNSGCLPNPSNFRPHFPPDFCTIRGEKHPKNSPCGTNLPFFVSFIAAESALRPPRQPAVILEQVVQLQISRVELLLNANLLSG
jgi:hypothetical protein